MAMETKLCPICKSRKIKLFITVTAYSYYECGDCEVIFISPEVLEEMDKGNFLIEYNNNYWKDELYAARERSWGTSLARVAEVFLYARLRIDKFIDIGSGPGLILDALNYQLPSSKMVFYANELFPPANDACTKNINYHKGSFLDFDFDFDAGTCIEVIEHITPLMLRTMMEELATKSKPNSIYIFNTGLVDFIKKEDIGYLDPTVRGHVMGWSIKGLQILLSPIGFKILPIPGKSWAFIAEFKPIHGFVQPIIDRIWKVLPDNKNILYDKKTGDLMYLLGLETARAYL